MLKVPDHQVAGHQGGNGRPGPLVDDSGRFYKPLHEGDERGSDEVSFYASFSSNTNIPHHIARFFPKCFGTQLVEASDGSGRHPYLVLQDLTFLRLNLSVMDVKIGSRTWAPQSPEDYINKCLKRDRETSSLSLGFRLSGLEIFGGVESGKPWKPEKRESVQHLSADEVKLLLKKFVSSNGVLDPNPDCAFASAVYTGILSQLLELKAWFEDQTMYHFYSCSILMMFEKELASGPRSEIKLVDFAHVLEGRGVIDHNFLGGLCSLINFISEILSTSQDFAPENDGSL